MNYQELNAKIKTLKLKDIKRILKRKKKLKSNSKYLNNLLNA